jgi:hypothetical protein
VHEPPLKDDADASDPARFVFVRDGFSFWAFLLTPLWMLRHRLWLVLLGYVVVVVALQVVLSLIGASSTVVFAVMLLLSLLVGFEGATLRRFTLGRRGWRNLGLVVGDDLESAEHRFFDAWTRDEAGSRSVSPSTTLLPRPAPASDIIGLFPHPGVRH